MPRMRALKAMGVICLASLLLACQTAPSTQPQSPPLAQEPQQAQATSPQDPSSPEPEALPESRADSIEGQDAARYSTAVERIFAEGLDLYEKAEPAAAIKKFESPEMQKAWPELRTRTLKYLAFSYCLTGNLNACQKAFYDAIQLNPQFKLEPAEENDPLWGPVYQKALLGPPSPEPERAAKPTKPAKPAAKPSARSKTKR